MSIQNEKVFADKVLEQLERKIDLVATKFMRRKHSGETSFLENRKEFEFVEGISRDIMNVLQSISPEKTMYVHDMLQRTSQLFAGRGIVKLIEKGDEDTRDEVRLANQQKKNRQFNCDYCFENKDMEEKSIYQLDEEGETVACVDCEKKAFEQ